MSEDKKDEENIEKIALTEDILIEEGYVIDSGKTVEITVLDNTIISG